MLTAGGGGRIELARMAGLVGGGGVKVIVSPRSEVNCFPCWTQGGGGEMFVLEDMIRTFCCDGVRVLTRQVMEMRS